MSRAAEVTVEFGGEERLFALPIGRLRAIQEKCDCGPLELIRRLAAGSWRVDDVREPLLQGLVGGGMDQVSATRLIQTNFDDLPILPNVPLAQAVLMAAIMGAEDEPLGEQEGEAAASHSPEESSASPASMAGEPLSA